MKCKNLLVRKRQKTPYFFCKLLRYEIILPCDENCLKRNLVRNKGIRKVSKKKISVKKEIYDQVIKRDNYRCKLCGTTENLQLHHIDGRGRELTNDINNCVILCMHCHLEVVHKNQKKYRPILKEKIKNDV